MSALTEHTTTRIGYRQEAITDTDAITGTTGGHYYNLGLRTQSLGIFPTKDFNTMGLYTSSRDPTIKITSSVPRASVGFGMITALPFYLFLGSVSTVTGVHTITGLDTGALPYGSLRFETSNGSEGIYKTLYDAKCKSINFSVSNPDLTSEFPAIIGMGFQGTDFKNAFTQSAIAPINAYGVSDHFKAGTNKANQTLLWNGTDELKNLVTDFKYIGVNANLDAHVQAQDNPYKTYEGPRAHQITLQVHRGLDGSGNTAKDMYDDAMGQTSSSSGFALTYKIYKDTTNYLQLAFTGCKVLKAELNDGFRSKGESQLYTFMLEPETLTVTAKDGWTALQNVTTDS